jgi:hypothetical protein
MVDIAQAEELNCITRGFSQIPWICDDPRLKLKPILGSGDDVVLQTGNASGALRGFESALEQLFRRLFADPERYRRLMKLQSGGSLERHESHRVRRIISIPVHASKSELLKSRVCAGYSGDQHNPGAKQGSHFQPETIGDFLSFAPSNSSCFKLRLETGICVLIEATEGQIILRGRGRNRRRDS